MKFDLHLRSSVREQIEQITAQMKSREETPRLEKSEEEVIRKRIRPFSHTIQREKLFVGAVSASGDFPSVCYGDSFIYLTTAQPVLYTVDTVSKLREVESSAQPVTLFTLLPEDETLRNQAFDEAFSRLVGLPVVEVIERSDYRSIKARESRKTVNTEVLLRELIRPQAGDAGNIAIQLRNSGELGIALRLIEKEEQLNYVLLDGTLSLPSVTLPTGSLFHEHLKRLCCVKARKRRIGFIAVSTSLGIPWIELLEKIAREELSVGQGAQAEHWYLRLPVPSVDSWQFSLTKNRKLPPAGAISYLVRFHRVSPLMRLDLDVAYWQEFVRGISEQETKHNERKLFEDLDYLSHDQRSYGTPYPLHSVNQRVALTKAERISLRQQIIDAAVKAGMKRSLFRESPGLASPIQE